MMHLIEKTFYKHFSQSKGTKEEYVEPSKKHNFADITIFGEYLECSEDLNPVSHDASPLPRK